MNFDPDGGLWAGDRYPQVLDSMFEQCQRHGVTRVLYRTSACGQVTYPSKVMTRQSCNVIGPVFTRLQQEFLEVADPLKIFCAQARQYELEPWAWITSFDSYAPALEDPFFNARPDLLMLSHPKYDDFRFGPRSMRGIPCYAEPETVEYRLQEALEVASYDIEGICYHNGTHTGAIAMKGDENLGQWSFGFNEPVVRRYKDLHGVDIRTEMFDSDKLRDVHGEFYTAFLRQVRDRLHQQGRRVMAAAHPEGWIGYSLGNRLLGFEGDHVMIANPWQQWLTDDVVDEVVLDAGHALVQQNLLEQLGITFDHPRRVMLWVHENHKMATGTLPDEIGKGLELCDRHGLLGITIHEAHWFLPNRYPQLWELLAAGVRRFCT